jgi:energy-coupling factor transporter ATP-binding protein EcfA2
MKLVQVKLQNFRCYKEEIIIECDDLTVFVGQNDSGKSSILDALDIFFDEKKAPDRDDVCVYGNTNDIRISCVFDELPAKLVIDATHPTDLQSEYLLNENELLEVVKVYNCSGSGKGRLKGVLAHAVHPTADGYYDLLALKITQLRERATNMGVNLDSVNESVSTELRRAIWAHAPDLRLENTLVELKSETAKEIWEQLKHHLPVYALFKSDRPSTDQDAEAQDPMKAAIQEETLDKIAEKVKEEVQNIADRTVEKIREMNPELASQLSPRVTTKKWESLFSVSLTSDDAIPINKRGSGTRRLILLNFFRAKAEQDAADKDSSVIYAVEEPETSQHPHNQRILTEAFADLAYSESCQVLLTTHTPVLARRFDQNSLRFIYNRDGNPVILYGREEEALHQITDSLGVLPDHNIRVFFGVEGRHDILFLRTISAILQNARGRDIPDLGTEEDAGRLVFVPLGGSSIDLWISRLEGFNRPEFYLMDRDTMPPADPHYKGCADEMNQRDNCTAWHTGKRELENYIHPNILRAAHPNYSGKGDASEDVPLLFAKAAHKSSESSVLWEDIECDRLKLKKKRDHAKKRLNTELVAQMTPALLSEIDPDDDIRGWLREIGTALAAD